MIVINLKTHPKINRFGVVRSLYPAEEGSDYKITIKIPQYSSILIPRTPTILKLELEIIRGKFPL